MNIIAHEQVTVKSEFVTLELIIWQRFKRQIVGLVEVALDLEQNRHLSGLGEFLPVGTVVTIPVPSERETQQVEVYSLWD